MDQFRLLNKTRQITEYSCGASALRSVLSYWGKDVDEEELMKLLRTSSDVGTYPEDIVRGARALGFDAEARQNLTLDEMARFTAGGNPVIALAQGWRSQRDSARSVAEDWDNGHYIVVLAIDQDYVYFQDPYVRMSKAFVPRKSFEEHWHQVMGGYLATNPRLTHLAIFIRGDKPAQSNPVKDCGISTLDFSKMGSMNMIIIQFRGFILPYDFLIELQEIWRSESIRPNAFIFLRKDKDSNVSGMEGSGLQDEDDAIAVNALIAAITSRSIGSPDLSRSKVEVAIKAAAAGDFGLSAGDIRGIAEKLPPDHSVIIGLFENAWERKLKDVARKYGGGVINQKLISPQALAKAAIELNAAAIGTSV